MTEAQSLINQLVQLQELIVANLQKKVSMPSAKLDELQHSINELSNRLPHQIKSHFYRLLQKHPEVIVPVSNELCSGCGMSLTKNMIYSVQKAEELLRCPNCARFLYYPEHLMERERTNRVYGETQKVGIARFTSPELMIVDLKGSTPEEILGELCRRIADEALVENPDLLLDLALQRESIVSTAAENGLAFPHVRAVEGGGLAMALGINRKGIKFDETSRALSRIFFFVVIPTAASAFYLKLIADLSRAFQDKSARDALLAARTDEELWKALLRTTRKEVK
ncbi:MAG: PTS sugar transporter subunit IIA [Pontiellaceae bacterium]|nr:PTS sugar transporter subunit IIA [Pontiellaceae bacterium]